MANPRIGMRSVQIKPGYQWVQPGLCAPEWRWFWHLVVFAEPIWGGNTTGTCWDYSTKTGASSVDTANASWTIGPRGRRRRWTGNNDYMYYNNGSSGSTLAPAQYYQPNDCAMFAVVEPTTVTNGTTHLLAWEGDQSDDGTANANTCFNISWAATNTVTHFHESGTGTNNNVAASNNLYTANERFSLCATRTKATKTVAFYKNGIFFSSNTYSTDCALGNKLYIDIGDRNNVTAGGTYAIECMYLFKAALTPAMIVQLDRDPWGAFRSARAPAGAAAGAGAGTGVRSFVAGMIG